MFGEVLTAMVTPFDENEIIATDVVTSLSKKLIKDGSDGIVLAGTTGESPNLSQEDRIILYKTTINSVGDKAKIVAGTGTYSTKESIELSKQAEDMGVDAVMIVTPYYSKPSQKGIYQHFQKISDAINIPIIAYNVPGRTSRLIEVDTLVEIVKDTNVFAIKDAVGDINFTKLETETFSNLSDDLDISIYSGDDKLTLEMMKLGAKGVISVASHIVGNEIRLLIDTYKKGSLDKAEDINSELSLLYDLIFEEPSPAPIKSILNDSFGYVGSCKLPLVDASFELSSKLINEYSRIKKLKL